MAAKQDHWNLHARQWSWIGSPLRPAEEDMRAIARALASWQGADGGRAPQVLLLGVTPEIRGMRWPRGTGLVALDHSRAMIGGVWRDNDQTGAAVCANWTAMPLAPASRDLIVGDGCFSALYFPVQYQRMVAEMRRVIRDGGLLLMRYFNRPERRESLPVVFGALRAGRIGNFHAFKWRLAMALHGTLDEGVRLADIWDAWHAEVADPEGLAQSLGWAPEAVRTIDAYRGVETRYTFPTLAESRAAVASAFAEVECLFPGYELGERCPTLVLRPR